MPASKFSRHRVGQDLTVSQVGIARAGPAACAGCRHFEPMVATSSWNSATTAAAATTAKSRPGRRGFHRQAGMT